MRSVILAGFLGVASLMLAGCGEANTTTGGQAPDVARPSAAPTVDSLLMLDRQANEAYIKSDAQFFEGVLHDRFIMYQGGRRMDKAATLEMVAATRCEVKDWKLEDPRMARIDADTYVLSYKGTFDGTCAGLDGKAMKIPSPIRAATIWVRSGSKWTAAFHGVNVIPDPKQTPPAKAQVNKLEANRDSKSSASANSAVAKRSVDAITSALMAKETSLWEAWKAKDAKQLDELTAPNLSFQNIFGTFFADRTATLKDWTGPHCDVKRVSVTDGAATLLSPTVGLLTRTGTAEGTCGGQKLTPVPIYGVSVFVKAGDSWKLAFSLNQL